MRRSVLAIALAVLWHSKGTQQTSSSRRNGATVGQILANHESSHKSSSRARSDVRLQRALQANESLTFESPSSLSNYTTVAGAAWDDRSARNSPPVRRQCSLFGASDGQSLASPPAVVVGGFGGSSTRHVAALLGSTGVYMTTRDENSQDTLAARSTHCALNSVEGVHARLRRRSSATPADVAATLFGDSRPSKLSDGEGGAVASGSAWAPEERTQLSCLSTMFDDDIASGAEWPHCRWGFKEPRLMYFASLMHFGLGATKYLHVVRDLRTMHHLHIEHDPRLWVSMLGGEAAYAAAVDAALARVLRAGLPMPALADCQRLADFNDNSNNTDALASYSLNKMKTPSRYSNGGGASGEEKPRTRHEKVNHQGSGVLRSSRSRHLRTRDSGSGSSGNKVNQKGGSRGNMHGSSSSGGGGSMHGGSSSSGGGGGGSKNSRLPTTCGAALAEVASQARAKKNNPCPNHQLSCSAVKDHLSHRVAYVVGWSIVHESLVKGCRGQPKPILLAPTNEPPSITAATSRQSAPSPSSSIAKQNHRRQRRQLRFSGNHRDANAWQSGDWQQWSEGDFSSTSPSLLSKNKYAVDRGALGNVDTNADGDVFGDAERNSDSAITSDRQFNKDQPEEIKVVNAASSGIGFGTDPETTISPPKADNLVARSGELVQGMATKSSSPPQPLPPLSRPSMSEPALPPITGSPPAKDDMQRPLDVAPLVKKIEAKDLFEPPSLTGATTSSMGSSLGSNFGGTYSSNEPPSLTGHRAAPAFEPPSPALAAALRANELRRKQKYGYSAGSSSRSSDTDSNQGVLFTSLSSQQQQQRQRQQQRQPYFSSSSSTSTAYRWLHLVKVETLWDPVTCSDAFASVLASLGLGDLPSSSYNAQSQLPWASLCSGRGDARDQGYAYAAPDPQPAYAPGHPSLTVAAVTAMALPGLAAMGYVETPFDDPLLENDQEAFLSVVFDDAKKKKMKTRSSGGESSGSSGSRTGSDMQGGRGHNVNGWGAALSMGSAGDDLRCHGPELRKVSREEAAQLQAEAAATLTPAQVHSAAAAAASAAANTAKAAGAPLEESNLLDRNGDSSDSTDGAKSSGGRLGVVSALARVLAVAAACAVLREWSVANHRRRNGNSSNSGSSGGSNDNSGSERAATSSNSNQSENSQKSDQHNGDGDSNNRRRSVGGGEVAHAFGTAPSSSELLASVARTLGFGVGFLWATAKSAMQCVARASLLCTVTGARQAVASCRAAGAACAEAWVAGERAAAPVAAAVERTFDLDDLQVVHRPLAPPTWASAAWNTGFSSEA